MKGPFKTKPARDMKLGNVGPAPSLSEHALFRFAMSGRGVTSENRRMRSRCVICIANEKVNN